jgi:hypothetical protein
MKKLPRRTLCTELWFILVKKYLSTIVSNDDSNRNERANERVAVAACTGSCVKRKRLANYIHYKKKGKKTTEKLKT